MMRKRTVEKTEEKEEVIYSPKSKTTTSTSRRIFLKVLFLFLFFLYFVIPFSVYFSPTVRRHAIFLHYVSLSRQSNLSLPAESGLKCARNFYISSEEGVKLGVWHVPPKSMYSKCVNSIISPAIEFSDQRPIFLYLHGNAGTRAGGHRVSLYDVLSQEVDTHIIAFDYRGFGDSSNVSPTAAGVVEDTELIYNWLLKRANSSRIFLWGHSLGTGVSTAFFEKIAPSSAKPAGLVLEAPFTKIIEAARHHPLAILHRYMPFFDVLVAQSIGDKETGFDNLGRIPHVTCPLLILHAEDDGFIPIEHGKKLYEEALTARKKSSSHITRFVAFDGKLDLGHKHIHQTPDLPNIIKDFIKSVHS